VTCDIEPQLFPEVVGGIKELPFKNNSFDLVAAYQVLEHLPWECLKEVCAELRRVTSNYLLLSVPYSGLSFELIIRCPLVWKLFKCLFVDFFIRMPYFFKSFKQQEEHYWELGWRGYSLKRFRRVISQEMTLIKEVRPALKTYHHFFLLKK
jgi:ubiquinone/menaquinone biosynthesis C-methylase UbiE